MKSRSLTNQVTYLVLRKLEFHLKDQVWAMTWYGEVLHSGATAWSTHKSAIETKKKNGTAQIHFKGEVRFSYCSESFSLCSYSGLCHSSAPAASDHPPASPAPLPTWTSPPLFVLFSFHTCTACVWQHRLLASNKNAVMMAHQGFIIHYYMGTLRNYYYAKDLQ